MDKKSVASIATVIAAVLLNLIIAVITNTPGMTISTSVVAMLITLSHSLDHFLANRDSTNK